MSTETDRTTLLIEILTDLALRSTQGQLDDRIHIVQKIRKLDEMCQPEPVTDDQDLRNPMA